MESSPPISVEGVMISAKKSSPCIKRPLPHKPRCPVQKNLSPMVFCSFGCYFSPIRTRVVNKTLFTGCSKTAKYKAPKFRYPSSLHRNIRAPTRKRAGIHSPGSHHRLLVTVQFQDLFWAEATQMRSPAKIPVISWMVSFLFRFFSINCPAPCSRLEVSRSFQVVNPLFTARAALFISLSCIFP